MFFKQFLQSFLRHCMLSVLHFAMLHSVGDPMATDVVKAVQTWLESKKR